MQEKPYRLGLLVGRFQMLHLGHEQMIRASLRLCDETLLLIGSSQEEGTAKNPFSFEQRAAMLRAVFGSSVLIAPLPDIGVGNNALWGEYVLETAEKAAGRLPDLFVSGRESRRTEWFGGPRGSGITELYLPKAIPVSASLLRGYLMDDDRAAWENLTSPGLHPLYESLRSTVLKASANTETRSI